MKVAVTRRSSPITVRNFISARRTSPARLTLPEGVEMVMPGDNVSVEVELQKSIAMEKGLKFAIREGGRTIGSGIVAEVVA